jgi:CRP-like cAMP-binding protein
MIDPRMLDGMSSLTVLSATERDLLAQYLDSVRFMSGDVLIHEGRRSPGAYLLLNGQIDVHKRVPGKSERVLTSPIPVGEWFGLVSLLDGLPATATVEAHSESLVVAMGRADFWKVVGGGDAFGVHFLRAMLRCTAIQLARIDLNVLRLRNQLARADGGLPPDETLSTRHLQELSDRIPGADKSTLPDPADSGS